MQRFPFVSAERRRNNRDATPLDARPDTREHGILFETSSPFATVFPLSQPYRSLGILPRPDLGGTPCFRASSHVSHA